MERARQQAQSYACSLPPDGRPPFLIVVDVGYTIALYAEFTRTGGHYIPFLDPHSYRLTLAGLHREEVQEMLRQVWLDPLSLDPAQHPRNPRDCRAAGGAVTAKQVAAGFAGARPARVEELLETLASLGQARRLAGGRFVGQ